MNAKRKLITSMLVAAFVILSVVATVAVAFALTQQTIKTSLNIGYAVNDIDGTASASYTIGGVTESLVAMKGNQVIGDTLVFKASDTEDAGNLMFPEDALALTSENDNVVIQYTYSNTGGKHYIASMDFAANIVADNMKVEYSINGTEFSEQRYAVVVPVDSSNKSYWIKISIADKRRSASFTGEFNWKLIGADDVESNESYRTLTSLEMQESSTEAGTYSIKINDSNGYIPAGQKVVFPSEINGDAVTTIAASNLTDAQKAKVSSVVIPESVTTIGTSAFENFSKLENFTIGGATGVSAQSATSALNVIEEKAFYGCKKLTQFPFPSSMERIGDQAFWHCGLTSICLPELDPEYRFEMVGNPFAYCEDLAEITGYMTYGNAYFEDMIEGIFVGCKNTDLSLVNPSIIGEYAFAGIKELTILNIPKTSWGGTVDFFDYAFADCVNLQKVIFGGDVDLTYANTFKGCTSLTELEINGDVYLDSVPFQGCPVSKITFNYLPEDEDLMYFVGDLMNAFDEIELTIGGEVTEIGNCMFNGCDTIKSLIIGDSITEIGCDAFGYCSSLTNITLGSNLQGIGDGAFLECSSLETITIPASVKRVSFDDPGAPVFDCSNTSLTNVIFEDPTGWKHYFEYQGNEDNEDGQLNTNGAVDESIMSNSQRMAQWFKEGILILWK